MCATDVSSGPQPSLLGEFTKKLIRRGLPPRPAPAAIDAYDPSLSFVSYRLPETPGKNILVTPQIFSLTRHGFATSPASRRRAVTFLVVIAGVFSVVALRDVIASNPYFHPHGYCYLWDAGLIWMHVGADLLIGVAYMTIPLALLTIVRRAEGGLPFSGMLVAFGTFIIACGFTHFVEVLTLWQPLFWTAAGVKLVTAIASVATAVAVPPLIPKVLEIIEAAKLAEERRVALVHAHSELEGRVEARTRELTTMVGRLQEEIAARNRAEHDLSVREAQLQAILDHSPSYIFLKDPNRRFTLVNRRLANTYGGAAHFIGRSNAELFPPELAAEYDGNDQRALAGDTVQAIEHEQAPNGAHTYLSEKFPIRDASGRVIAMGGISTDITDRERLREERETLLARERELRQIAEQTLGEKDEFLAVISHELRTPLNAVLGYLRMFKRGLITPEAAPRVLSTIERNTNVLHRLVEDLLTASGIVTRRLELRPGPLDIALTIGAAVETVRPDAEAKQITMATHVAPSLIVRGDEERLQQVFANVLGNAVKFSAQGGQVRVDAVREGSRIRIEVTDHGAGIAGDFLPHVFEAFRQGDSGPKRETGGMGLGLAIVRRLVEAHGGEVSAESAGPGHGATFTVWLPAISPE
jgi:PAS domain S-box-containing protein